MIGPNDVMQLVLATDPALADPWRVFTATIGADGGPDQDLNHLARFIVQLIEAGEAAQARRWFDAVEHVVGQHGPDAQACICMMFLEDLQLITSHLEIEATFEQVEALLGPLCRADWDGLQERWEFALAVMAENKLEFKVDDAQFLAMDPDQRAKLLSFMRRTKEGNYLSIADLGMLAPVGDDDEEDLEAE